MRVLLCFALLAVSLQAQAQTNLSIYSDELDSAFQNWSWGGNNFSTTAPVYAGAYSIGFSGSTYQAISVWHQDFNPAPYTNLSFWINSGGTGGQVIQIYVQYGTNTAPAWSLPALPATTNWEPFIIPFSTLRVAGVTNLNRITFQLVGGAANPFYLDDISLTGIQPAVVHLAVDASVTVRAAEANWFGLNTAVWDGNFDTTTTSKALTELDTHLLRFPGGSLSDTYHWVTNSSWDGRTWTRWGTSFNSFIHVATNVGAQAIITVNYGMGTSNEAAAWVKSANVTNHLGFKYWEIGNECYGTWETDSNSVPHDPYTYALRARDYITQMKLADPSILIGVVAAPGEGTYANNTTHFAVNPRTGATHYGWTPILLSTLKALGVRPDFLIHHVYPEYGVDSDQGLLLASANWAGDAGDLRQQIADYFGSDGANIELFCTENNSDSGNQGRQSTSIGNGLYLADSLGELMKTEFNSFIWWDLRNGTDTSGDFDASLYGWRTFGDLGVINGPNTRLPAYYAFKLMQYFAQPGDTLLNPTTDYALLSVHAARKADGALAVLVINKDRYATLAGQMALAHFVPGTSATVRRFGLAQDEATRTNSVVPGAQDIATNAATLAGTNFSMAFPPYSMTLLTISPAAPTLTVVAQAGSMITLQVTGQPDVPYVLESSTNLSTWSCEGTNTLTGNTWTVSTNASVPLKFWRAAWRP